MGLVEVEHVQANLRKEAPGSQSGGHLVNGDTTYLQDRRPLHCNDPAKPWVVQKFGGTSTGKAPDVISEHIIKHSLEEYQVVAVCSARSGDTKATGTTNRLLRAARDAASRQGKAYHDILQQILADHTAQANTYISSSKICAVVCGHIEKECAKLLKFLEAIEEIGEVSTKSLDTVISKGELLACHLMAGILEDKKVEACCVDLSDVINFEGDTNDLDNLFYKRLTNALVEKLRACGNKVPVLTGYFGRVKGGLLNRIGRGYTDLCAALVAVGLQAQELQIWKEVDGIFTANPSKVPTARLLPTISPAEAAELTFYGSEVIHPFTMEQVIKARIPIRIRNVMNLRNPGTVIAPEPITCERPSLPPSSPSFFRRRSPSKPTFGQKPPRPTAITIKHKILVLNVHSNKRSLSHGFFSNIFSTLDRWKLSVDLISTSEVHVSMALHSESALTSAGGDDEKEIIDESLRGAITDLAQYGTVDLIDGMAILSLVGKQMKNMIGIAGKMFTVLGENNVNIEMISQGASEINISCVIEEKDSDRAINILHTNIFTFFD